MWYRVIIFVVVSLGERVEIDFGEGIWLAMGCGAVWIDDGGGGAALSTATAGSEKAGWADAGAASSTEAVPDAVATTTTTADGQYRLRW